MEQSSEIINAITTKTESELLLFFVLLAAFFLVVTIPMYSMFMNDRKERRQSEERRSEQDKTAETGRMNQIISVIAQNSEAMAGLKTAMESFVGEYRYGTKKEK